MIDEMRHVELLADALRRDAARRRRALSWARYAVAAAALALAAAAVSHRVRELVVRARLARMRPTPPRLPLAGMERLHAQQLPRWMLRLAAARADGYEAYRARVALATIAEGARDFPAVGGAAHERLSLGATEHPTWSPWRALPVVQQWNAALDAAGLTVHLDATVEADPGGPVILVDVYRTAFDGAVMVGARKVRARYLQRIDRTNLVESWLGVVSHGEDGARVVLDRVRDFALDQVWPRMDPSRGDAPSVAVRDEARRALLPEHFAALARTAAARAAMLDAARAINARASCGSSLRMPRVPWPGFDARGCRTLLDAAEPAGARLCPRVTHDEALAIAEGSVSLAGTERLEGALAALVGHVARAVTVHEARHAADLLARETGCAGCPRGVTGPARAELAAYLASFSDPLVARTALLQACVARHDEAHGAAVALALSRLGDAPCASPPADLWRRARALTVSLFGRADEITLDGRFGRAVRRVP